MSDAAKSVLVTGGASGIGRAVVELLLRKGMTVVILDLPGESLELVAAELRIDAIGCDLATVDFAEFADRVGPLAGIVHSAGVTDPAVFDELTPQHWRRVIAVNVEAPLFLTKALIPRLGTGSAVVMLSSIEAFEVVAMRGLTMAGYSPSKAAVSQLVKVLAWELGPRGIRVNAVAPGLTRTPLARPVIEQVGDWTVSQTPLRRLGDPSDIANAVAFLLSPEAGFITAQTLVVDGGLSSGHGGPPEANLGEAASPPADGL